MDIFIWVFRNYKIWTRNFVIFTMYASFFSNYIREIDHFMLDVLKSFSLWTMWKCTSMNKSLKQWNYRKSPLIQEKHSYKWPTIKYNSINTGTSQNILWNNSSMQMWSTSKDWKTGCHKNWIYWKVSPK